MALHLFKFYVNSSKINAFIKDVYPWYSEDDLLVRFKNECLDLLFNHDNRETFLKDTLRIEKLTKEKDTYTFTGGCNCSCEEGKVGLLLCRI